MIIGDATKESVLRQAGLDEQQVRLGVGQVGCRELRVGGRKAALLRRIARAHVNGTPTLTVDVLGEIRQQREVAECTDDRHRGVDVEIDEHVGEIISVDVEGWDGESKDNTGAKFTFSPRPKPLPEDTEEPQLDDAEVRENDADSTDAGEPDTITPDVPGDGGSTAAGTDLESGSGSDSDDDGHNPPPAGAGQPM